MINDFESLVNSSTRRSTDNWGTGIILQSPSTGKVLLARRTDTGTYGTPGGKVELGETPVAGVLRECFEESGVTVKELICYGNNFHSSPNGKNWVDFLFYSNNFDDSNIVNQQSEMEPFNWYTVEDALNLDLFPPSRYGLEAALSAGVLSGTASNYIKYVDCPVSASAVSDSPPNQYSWVEPQQTYEGKLVSPWIYWD